MGYDEAVHQDPSSLSYVVEPDPDYGSSPSTPAATWSTGRARGRSRQGSRFRRIAWIEGILQQADHEGKAVIAFAHHGIVEHFPGQANATPNTWFGTTAPSEGSSPRTASASSSPAISMPRTSPSRASRGNGEGELHLRHRDRLARDMAMPHPFRQDRSARYDGDRVPHGGRPLPTGS
jgi:hypothetical protein